MTISEVSGVDIIVEHNNNGRTVSGVIEGSGNTFTYQVLGSGTATIQGSNNGVDWVNLTEFPITAPGSVVLLHSWLYIKVEGTASVIVSRG